MIQKLMLNSEIMIKGMVIQTLYPFDIVILFYERNGFIVLSIYQIV